MLILGCGYTGLRLAKRRMAAHQDVLGVVSSAATAERVAAANVPCRQINFDAAPTAALQANGPAVYLIPPPRSGDADPRLNAALNVLHTTRLIYISTTGVYGNRDGKRVSENDTPNPESARAVRRLAAETSARQWCEARNIPWIILRVPGIYGPDRLQLASVKARRPMLEPSAAGPGNRIHVDDLVRCIDAALTTPNTGRIYNVGDGHSMTNTEFVAEVARQTGAEPPPTTDIETMRANATPQAWSFMRESRVVDTTRMREELGVVPRYLKPADGIAASLIEMGNAGP
ncbi:MAG: NAD-dependent epimerase/dehydratase family protein [Gammaproteobacteria bacterium]